jgi:hypothetical protein
MTVQRRTRSTSDDTLPKLAIGLLSTLRIVATV